MKKIVLAALSLLFVTTLLAQKPYVHGWHLLDYEKDGYWGISLDLAYELLKGRQSVPVLVGVIDSGIDTTHEDLKKVLWRNTKEVPGDGVDNDNNGYPDDIYGWNYLGNRAGENVTRESMEITRIYQRYAPKYAGKNVDTTAMDAAEKATYKLWLRADQEGVMNDEDRMMLRMVKAMNTSFLQYDSLLTYAMKKDEYNTRDLEAFEPALRDEQRAKMNTLRLFEMLQFDAEKTNLEVKEELDGYINHQQALAEVKTATDFDMRGKITGDDPYDWNSRDYGNNDVMTTTSRHGTHVSGIIGADRTNDAGIKGIADNVKIIAIRAVPDGDEHDKDVALAIRYAVDQGAKVINMSFGKAFSPNKQWVDDAIRYAAEKDVLLVSGSGNDAENMDEKPSFPTALLNDGTIAPNVINVGASSDSSITPNIIAEFSNYGRHSVDVLAPGKKIYSTVPTGNRYAPLDGTSMASPVVAGVAALLRSYFPHLTAVETKNIIEKSADMRFSRTELAVPGGNPEMPKTAVLNTLFKNAGLVNAASAVKMAIDSEKLK